MTRPTSARPQRSGFIGGGRRYVMDGRRLDGTLIPLQKVGTSHQVTVTVSVRRRQA